jgi:xanthine dehydrogenase accessory factor
MPDDLIASSFHDNHCAIVALAHDPRVDDMAMMQALKTDAFYVGAMGSLITSNKRRERLLELELQDKQIEKLHAPIGVNIHSRTPYEIAVSIAAQLIAERSNRKITL